MTNRFPKTVITIAVSVKKYMITLMTKKRVVLRQESGWCGKQSSKISTSVLFMNRVPIQTNSQVSFTSKILPNYMTINQSINKVQMKQNTLNLLQLTDHINIYQISFACPQNTKIKTRYCSIVTYLYIFCCLMMLFKKPVEMLQCDIIIFA